MANSNMEPLVPMTPLYPEIHEQIRLTAKGLSTIGSPKGLSSNLDILCCVPGMGSNYLTFVVVEIEARDGLLPVWLLYNFGVARFGFL